MSETPQPIEIVVWGPSGSGKTMLLAQIADRDHTSGTGWNVYAANEETRAAGAEKRRSITGENRFPSATRVGEEERLQYHFANQAAGERFRVTLEDRPGSSYEDVDDDARNYLGRADGLVLLFDAMGESRVLFESLTDTLEKLHQVTGAHEDQKDPRPVAICLSKADALLRSPVDVRRASRESEARAFVTSWIAETRQDDILGKLDKHCGDNYMLFPVSAAGLDMRYGVVRSAVLYDEEFTLRVIPGASSVNLIEPFLWVYREVLLRRAAAGGSAPR